MSDELIRQHGREVFAAVASPLPKRRVNMIDGKKGMMK